jgi:hypothetical protein
MTTTGPVGVFVDCDELDRLRSELEALSHELTWMESRLARTDEDMGGPEVSGAVEQFRAGWGSTRSRLAEELLAAAGLVRTAIQAYETTETLLKAAVSDVST